MLYIKKVLFAVLSAFVIIAGCDGCHIIFPTTAEVYKNNWGITLPDNLEKQYDVSEYGGTGDGWEYEIFSFKNNKSEVSFLSDMSSQKNDEMQNGVTDILKEVKADEQQYPNFSHNYEWKTITNKKNDKLYIIYDEDTFLLYFVQDIY